MGDLPNIAHGVQGELCVTDQSTLVIKGFYYDTGGPGLY